MTKKTKDLLEKNFPKENIKFDELMKKHTSFKIGGPAECFIKICSIDDLKKILKIARENNEHITIIGNGSNLLVSSSGIKGIVIKLDFKEIYIKHDDESVIVIADAGVPLCFLAHKLLKEEISGFEGLSGIPGLIGGAVVMNAGAHGTEIKDIITEVVAMDYEANIHKFTNEQSKFEYRNSRYSDGKYIILQVKMKLNNGNMNDIKEKMNEYAQFRKDKQPIEYPSAGSIFKRGEDFITAKLIDDAGLKGYQIGGAKVSEKHAGFIINTGNATFNDVVELIEYITDKVYKRFGKKIKTEVKIIGE